MTRGLTGPWLASRLGLDPVKIEIRRRAGELHAVRPPGSDDWVYPSWQFDEDWQVRPEVRRLLSAARDARLSAAQLDAVLERRAGLSGGQTLRDVLLRGEERPVLDAVTAAATRS